MAYRVPIERPIATSFGMMRDRPAVVIRAEDEDGTVGWGESWCNFPTVGAEHRARLITENCAGLVGGREWPSPQAVYRSLTERLHILALQAAEPGPIAQAIAGVDMALWDLAARKAGVPLYQYLGTAFDLPNRGTVASLPCYASGISPEGSTSIALAARDDGYRAFKLKIGFDDDLDLRNLKAMREALGVDAPIMVDANQRWDLAKAKVMADALGAYQPAWLEEPLAADRPSGEWQELSASSPIPLAAGENLRGQGLIDICERSALKFIQPDLAKWGGFSGCLEVACLAIDKGKIYCPHYLGGGIGLMASAHLLAAVGGPGTLEIDYNPNLLREKLAQPFPAVTNGRFAMPQTPGLGIEPDLKSLEPYRTF
ncbi:MAG: mandelate racemase/muconate lactonizing enzyme family protein [Alphaproteobacteria bacterium]